MYRSRMFGLLALVTVVLLATPAAAQPLHAQPASLLIFPLYNSTEGNNTLVTVTNTNEDERSCNNGFREGDVRLHFVYFSETCQESDTQEDLTPADTITVLTQGHNPNFEKGYLVVEARDPEELAPNQFDFLIGSAIVVNSEFDFQWAYTPYAFEAIFDGVADLDACDRPVLISDDGFINFDDIEYSSFPETLYLDHFFGEGTNSNRPNVAFSNMLFLMSTQAEDTDLAIIGYNNNERRFSRSFNFDCYFMGALSELTGAVTQTALDVDGDDGELAGINYGWLKLNASTRRPTRNVDVGPGILGVYVENAMIGGDSFVSGRELQYTGSKAVVIPRLF